MSRHSVMKLMVVMVVAVLFAACESGSSEGGFDLDIIACSNAGGKWVELRNSCAGRCAVADELFCAQAFTMSCDCGEGACWDGSECVEGHSYGDDVIDRSLIDKDDLTEYQSCDVDADCIFVTNGCCDCANGGEETAINKDLLDEFEDEFDCDGVACTERARVPACGSGTVSCVDGMCSYTL